MIYGDGSHLSRKMVMPMDAICVQEFLVKGELAKNVYSHNIFSVLAVVG